ncbi:MAG: DUF4290 domain-containing protein [Prevotella sp.]|jgi:hypothetical protein|nr:DUF4290 domain-containing protein [Prevotella sp.]
MQLEGLDYNTQREKLKLMAYGRDIQQMVERCIELPTKEQRQKCAETIISTMRRVVPSSQNQKERMPVLWYHLALMSDFKLDIDYPVEIEHEDKMAQKPGHIDYTNKRRMPIRHYGRLLFEMFEKLKEMPEGEERTALVNITAGQMYRSLVMWGMATADKEKVASDLARFTDGVIQISPDELKFETAAPVANRRKKKK